MNDAGQYNLLPQIGPGQPLPFPHDCCLLADKGYANQYPLMTSFRNHQLPPQGIDRDRMLVFNSELSSKRVFVEHVIKEGKNYSKSSKGVLTIHMLLYMSYTIPPLQ